MSGGTQCGSGLGGVLLGFAEFGDGFGERGQPGDEHGRGQRPVAGQVGERGDMSRAACRSWFPAGVGGGMRPWGTRAARS